MSEKSRSVPIMIHRTASQTPVWLVNHKKYLSDNPQLIDCPRCKHHGETEIRFVNGMMTWLSFLVILIAGVFIFPLFFLWVPFFVETFKDCVHHCPNWYDPHLQIPSMEPWMMFVGVGAITSFKQGMDWNLSSDWQIVVNRLKGYITLIE